jgi:hypothetical protein
MIAKIASNGCCTGICSLLACFFFLSPAPSRSEDTAEADREACGKNLATLFIAIQGYRADHKNLPDWLSDLVPKNLRDANLLICPTARRTGNVNTLATDDPKIATTYSYQFSNGPIPKVVPGGEGYTMKEWKRRQMGLVGSKVPMVRCHNHGRVLNISFDGNISESEGAWENALSSEIDTRELFPNRIFAREATLTARARAQSGIPARSTNTPSNCVDLTKYFNAALNESWNPPGNPAAHHLEALPTGVQKFGNIPFDIRGRIQLSSKKLTQARYPLSVKNIKVDQKAARLHFVHSTGWSASSGTAVCTYVMHLANGESTEFTVQYGAHINDWTKDSEPQDSKNSIMAWSGPSPVNSQMTLRVYKTQWTNPEPDQAITSIDFISANSDPAPFLIAITAETL